MRLFSYVVARDYGFAPNPFHGRCTLATCKPRIRNAAAIGDWVIGTGSSTASKEGRLVYAMRITKTMTFNQYWMAETKWTHALSGCGRAQSCAAMMSSDRFATIRGES